MTLGHDQAKALAAFINTLRPDWDKPGILHYVGAARFRGDTAGVSIAAIRAALDPNNRTPAVIAMDGRHWNHADVHVLATRRYDHPCRRCDCWHGPDEACSWPVEDVRGWAERARKLLRGKADA
jgi:hypothetical protein